VLALLKLRRRARSSPADESGSHGYPLLANLLERRTVATQSAWQWR